MVEQEVVGAVEFEELAVIARERFEPVVCRLDENLRRVPYTAQDALDAESFVADCVAVAERRQNLVDLDHARLRASLRRSLVTGPTGSFASVSFAAGTFRRRRSSQPGSRSIVRLVCSFRSRSSMSKYL